MHLWNCRLIRFVKDAQQEIIHQYVAARIAGMLMVELQDCDVITRRNNHFVALLPEASRESVDTLVQKLETAAQEQLGLKLKIGLSTFPDEAVTFESLLENAEAKMENKPAGVGGGQLTPASAQEVSLEAVK